VDIKPVNNSWKQKLLQLVYKPVDNSPLILFRIGFGFLLFYHCISFIQQGKVFIYFIEPPFTFTFIGFEFLQPLPGNGMYFYFGLMALFGLMIMLGAWYRFSMVLFTLLWTGIYLMQKSGYNNHYYLICLLCWLMCFMPANKNYAIDVWRKPQIKEYTCPHWIPLLFITQTAIVYFFAATSKLNGDWLSGKFIALQFEGLSKHHWLGFIYGNSVFQQMICYGGLLFDFFIVPLLLWKKTRKPAFALFCLFHLFNSYSFRIGIFPYLSITMAVFFFNAETIRKIFFRKEPAIPVAQPTTVNLNPGKKLLAFFLAVYLIFQLYLPMRSWFYPGNVFWTEEGYRMSWKMMLRKKTGTITFKLHDPVSGKTWVDDPLQKFKPQQVYWIAICPDIAWQYAQRLKKDYNKKGFPHLEIYAIDSVRLNNSHPQLLINPNVDLATIQWQVFRHAAWLMPFNPDFAVEIVARVSGYFLDERIVNYSEFKK